MAFSRSIGLVSRLLITLFFSVFLAAGLFFFFMIGRMVLSEAAPYLWARSEAVMISAEVRQSNDRSADRYELEVHYRYEFGGQEFAGDRFTTGKNRFSDLGELTRLKSRFAADTRVPCWVDPKVPREAVLERGSLWKLFIILFPLPFVAIGAGGICYTWRTKPASEQAGAPISERAAARSPVLFLRLFGTFFFILGALASYLILLKPLAQIRDARGWRATPCEVLSSRVVTHSGSKGRTYSVEVRYSYQVGAVGYQANRYNFSGGASSGYNAKQAIVRKYPPRAHSTCYVNPLDPSDAVLDRTFSAGMWFGLIPLVFVVVGVAIIGCAPRMAGTPRGRPDQGPSALERSDRRSCGPFASGGVLIGQGELKASSSPVGKLVGITFFALFWCGITSVFVYHAVQSWRTGRPEWFLTIFITPFVLIGLGTLAAIPYQFLALFNPRVRLIVSPRSVPLGGTLALEWSLIGRTARVRRLRLLLEGREETTYRRGTTTSTDKHVFIVLPLLDSTDSGTIAGGNVRVTIPAGLMHTFASSNNKIVWSLRVKGEIPRWPDLSEEYPFSVLPLRIRA